MNRKLMNITAAILAVVFLIGILPLLLSRTMGRETDLGKIRVNIGMPNKSTKTLLLEEYLIGVLAAEMPASFEMEALKAQSVAARTYALKRIEKLGDREVHVDTTTKTQAYLGRDEMLKKWGLTGYFKYRQRIAQAVQATQGEVLTYQGKLIDAVYHSSSGRKGTERASEVWGTEVNYLSNVASGEENPLRFVQHQVFDPKTVYEALGFSKIPTEFRDNELMVIERTDGGRVKNLMVSNRIFSGTDFRMKLNLPSADFEWRLAGAKRLEMITYGKGHAVGMSQYGSNDLAKAGKRYTEILGHYYQGTKLVNYNEVLR